MIGIEIGSYRLISKIGEGGMGEVYVGEHVLLRRKVAIKVLLKSLSADETVAKRFINEARTASTIGHRGIVQVIDFGRAPDGTAYMIMELLEGSSLTQRLRDKGALSIPEATNIIKQMADALAAAHVQKVVHRDLKPDNVFLVPDADAPGGERVKILDFGIAKQLDPTVSGPHTKTGSVLGTPVYMAPEQCLARPNIDHRADIYSLGCVFFQLVTGRPPFDFPGIGELISAHVYSPPPLPSSVVPTIPPSLDAIIVRMLAKKPEDRFTTMGELLEVLEGAPAKPLDGLDGGITDLPTLQPDAPSDQTSLGFKKPDTLVDAKPPDHLPDPHAAPTDKSVEQPVSVRPTSPMSAQKKEITTLGGSTGEAQPPLLPQHSGKKSGSLAPLLIAFGVTVPLLLGVFFLLGRRSVVPAAGDRPAAAAATAPAAAADQPDLATLDSAQ